MRRIVLVFLCVVSHLTAQEPLTPETVTANRTLWPREVTVHVPHQVPIVVNGKPSGSMQAPAGRVYAVKSLGADGVLVDAGGSSLTFPVADTDLVVRAGEIQTRLASQPAATPVPAVQSPPPPQATPPPEPTATNTMAAKLAGDLIVMENRKPVDFDAASLGGKKFLAIYFSAAWCPPCRGFTPELVSWYKRKKSARDQFDIIFVSRDKSEGEMLDYMKDYKMDWPALRFDKAKGSPLGKYLGRGIPCLVVIDGDGKVLSHSYDGENYRGPTQVMKDLEKLLKGS